MTDLQRRDWAADPIFDSTVMSHGFTSYMRDYDVVIEVPAVRPEGSGSDTDGRLAIGDPVTGAMRPVD